jgi:HK97 gp10 family phage protein
MARRSSGASVLGSSSMTLEGAEELLAKLAEMGAAVMTVVWQAAEDGATVIKDRANDLAPGPNIELQFHKTAPGLADVAIGFPKDKYYYQFFETGTTAHEISPQNRQALHGFGTDAFSAGHVVGGISARPFLRPAIDEGGEQAKAAVGRRLVVEIQKYEE